MFVLSEVGPSACTFSGHKSLIKADTLVATTAAIRDARACLELSSVGADCNWHEGGAQEGCQVRGLSDKTYQSCRCQQCTHVQVVSDRGKEPVSQPAFL